MSKKSIIFIIIVIFTVSLISGVAIVLKEKQEKATVTEKPTTTTQEPSSQPATQPATPKPSGEPKSDSMGSWETYANQTYGFKVKYPRDWQVKEEPLPVYPDTFTVKVSFVSPSLKDKVVFNVRPKGDEGMIREASGVDEGASEGDTITFFINGYPAMVTSGTPIWSSGGSRQVVSLQSPPPCVKIDLGEGWNLVSFNVNPSDNSMPNILSSIEGSYTYVSGYKSSVEGGPGFETYVPGRPFNDLSQLDHYHGYWIKMSSGGTLEICGRPVAVTIPIELGEGWNLVSYLPSESGAMPDVLSSVDGSYTYVSGYKSAIEGGPGFETYVPGRPFNDLSQLDPRHGYWIKMSSGGTLTYPTSVPQPQAAQATVQAAPSLESSLDTESISGHVSDGTQGIEGATVQAWQNNKKIKETTTSSDGSYSLSGLEAENYYVRAYKHGYYAKILKNQTAPKSNVDIILILAVYYCARSDKSL